MSNEENDIFLKQMKGVTPIKKNNRSPNNKTNQTNIINKTKTKPTNFNDLKAVSKKEVKNSYFALESFNIKKNIKKNILKIDKKTDFHGKSLLEAEEIFSSTILECFKQNKRCLLFVTGKGLFKAKDNDHNNKPRLYHGVIRAEFFNWVKSKKFSKHILSFEQASIEHGGDGAFYVYLRKNKN